jgi:hypothetical protein
MASDLKPLEEHRVRQLRCVSGQSSVWNKFVTVDYRKPNEPHLDLFDQEWWELESNRDSVAFTFHGFIINNCAERFNISDYVPPEWIDDVKSRMIDIHRFMVHHPPANHSNW